MRFSTSMIMAAIATLAVAAPTPAPSVDISSFLQSGSQSFNTQSFNQQSITILLQSFDLNGFNSQFGQSRDQNAIQLLILSLGQNSFGNSNFNGIQDLSQFNVFQFASQFNNQFQSNWNVNEILVLLVNSGLFSQSQINQQLILVQQVQQNVQFAQSQFVCV